MNHHTSRHHHQHRINKYNLKAEYYVAALLIFIIVLFQLPILVGGGLANYDYDIPSCGNGVFNSTDKLCSCLSGYYGYKCDQMYCPRGKSWTPYPETDHVRNMPIVECSNMGICNTQTGQCACRDGFEGRACERSTCLLSNVFDEIVNVEAATEGFKIDSYKGLPKYFCSGHGRCLTLRDNGFGFDGINQLRPPMNYESWDSDMIQGCSCDAGWTGTDCGQRLCPFGIDPMSATAATREKYVLQCKAASGYFTIFAKGSYTAPIPFNADPQLIKTFLEAVPGMGKVQVSIPLTAGVATVCSANSVVSTEISFLDHPGRQPPIFVTRGTSKSREFPDSYTPIPLPATGTVLRMATVYVLPRLWNKCREYLVCCSYCNARKKYYQFSLLQILYLLLILDNTFMSNQINLSSFHSVLLYKRSYNASLRTSLKINCNCNNVTWNTGKIEEGDRNTKFI